MRSPSIGKVWGIPVRLHWSFLLLLALVIADYGGGPMTRLLETLAWFVAIFASVVVHELSHCRVARRRGLEVREILLLPIGGVSEIPRLRRGSPDEFVVSLAGPIASLALAVCLGILAALLGEHLWPPTMFAGAFLVRLTWANLMLGGFNLLPVLPLDGGHVLRADLSRRRPESAATLIAARAGTVVGYAMILLGVFVNLWVTIIGVFIVLGGGAERRIVLMRELLGGRRVADVMVRTVSVLDASTTVGESAALLLARPGQSTPVAEEGRYVGMVSSLELQGASDDEALGHLADREAPLLSPEDDLYPDAVVAFSESHRSQLAVAEEGKVVGVLYNADVQSLLRRAEQSIRPAS